MYLLPKNLASIADLTATETGRYSMMGVHLRFYESEDPNESTYIAEATDGQFAVRVSGPCIPSGEYPTVSAFASAPNGATEGLIPAAEWYAAFKSLPKKLRYDEKRPLQNVAVVLGDDVVTLASTDGTAQTVLQPRQLDGRFPKVDEVYPKNRGTIAVKLNAARLITILRAAQSFLSETAKADQFVTVELFPDGKPARIVATQGDQKFDALLMPVS